MFYICSFGTLSSLIGHLKTHHNTMMETCEMMFSSMAEFLEWKEQEQLKESSQYVRKCAPQVIRDNRIWYYYCNRSGKYVCNSSGIRQTKSQGSEKIGVCSAHMKVIENIQNGNISIVYCKTHHNHKIELGHLRLPESTRLEIAAKLHNGVSIERILDDIRDSGKQINRGHLATRQDIHNIKNNYNIEGVSRHMNDLSSVNIWVEQLQSCEYNPVILHKTQGKQGAGFNEKDFALGIQTEFQRDMLKKFGNCTVCIDTTYNTNMYDFYLTTLLVIDEYGEGIPVAWIISNRQDGDTLSHWFKSINSKTGMLNPKWFMSDDAEQFFNAWTAVFGGGGMRKLLCAWHVDKAWRKALDNVKDINIRIELYHFLQALLQENEVTAFRIKLQHFLTIANNRSKDFHSYFLQYYAKRVEQWASCYRVGTTVNTNMFVESFHRVLKVVYLQHKQNRRIDYLLHILLKIARDKTFERLIKLEKGKHTHRICDINRRHKFAQEMLKKSPSILHCGISNWKVESNRRQGEYYTVEKLQSECCCNMKCSLCETCVHMYSCT